MIMKKLSVSDLRSLVKIYAYLDLLYGSDEPLMEHWLSTPNLHLDGEFPGELALNSPEKVSNYLEGFVNH